MKLQDLPKETMVIGIGNAEREVPYGSRFTKEELKRAEPIVKHLEGLTINSAAS